MPKPQFATILDKTTWENVFIFVHYLTQQNYFQINENPLPQFKVASYKCLGFRLLKTQEHCFQGEGGREESVGYDVKKKCPQVRNFLNSFVQDCSSISQSANDFFSSFFI